MRKSTLLSPLFAFFLQFGAQAVVADDTQFLEDGLPSTSDGRQFMANRKSGGVDELDRGLYQVRCWQNGNLIIDEANWRVPQIHATFAAFRDAQQSRPGLYLLEFGHAICQVKVQGEEVPAAPEPAAPKRAR